MPQRSSTSVHRVTACTVLGAHPLKSQRASPSTTLGSAIHGCCGREGAGGHPAPGSSAGGRKQKATPAHRDGKGNLKHKTCCTCPPRKGKQLEATLRSGAAPGKSDVLWGFASSHPAAVTLLVSTTACGGGLPGPPAQLCTLI